MPEEKDAIYLIEVPIVLLMRLVKTIVFSDPPGAPTIKLLS